MSKSSTYLNEILNGFHERLALGHITQAHSGDDGCVDDLKSELGKLFMDMVGESKTHDLGTFTQNELDRLEVDAAYVVGQGALRAELRTEIKQVFNLGETDV